MRPTLLGIGLAVSALGSRAGAQPRPAIERADLYRCTQSGPAPCLGATVSLDANAVRQTAGRTEAVLTKSWRARFRTDTALLAVARRAAMAGAAPASRVLVLVDVSGSMKSEFRFVSSLSALRFFLHQLDSLPRGSTRVAIAAFGSRNVRDGVTAARFQPPDSARRQVDLIRQPDRENTGLYSAIQAGVERLEAELSSAGEGTAGHLVVITDGNNQVMAGDDPGLLDGATGLATSAAAVADSRSIVTIIGIGTLNQSALEKLAGERGRVATVPDAQFKLGPELTAVRDLLASSWEVVVPLALSREDLGRSWGLLRTRLDLGPNRLEAGVFAWVPPLIALPAYGATLAGGLVSETAVAQPRLDGRWLLAAMLAVAMAFLWFLLPQRLWPAPVVVAPTESKKAAPKEPAGGQGLRLDVKEAPPRKPSDVTASKARRA